MIPKPGRPSKYDETYDEDLIRFLAEGYSFEASCSQMGIDTTTGYDWIKKHPTFSHAFKVGKGLGQAKWEKMALDHAVESKEEGKKVNAAVWIFTMKSKYGVREEPQDISDDEDLEEPI